MATAGSLAAASFFLSLLPAPTVAAASQEAVAIVYQLTGEAHSAVPGRPAKAVHLFDHLPAGIALEVAPGAHLALAFMTGLRFELGGRSRVTLGLAGLASRAGLVRDLASVSPMPHVSPIATRDHPGSRPGGIRLRGGRIEGLYPHRGTTTLAKEVLLNFHPVAGVQGYRIEVRDRQGDKVFGVDVASPPLKLPSEALKPGAGYRWTVRTLGSTCGVARGEAELVTLSEADTEVREISRKVLTAEGPASLPLLAEIDFSLGLLVEAREDLRTALSAKPGDPALRDALAEVEARLAHNDDSE
jgi:hypothetical protein